MAFSIRFNEEKNQLLKATRGICFDDAIEAFKDQRVLADIAHPNRKYSHQRVFVIQIHEYAYAVPYVKDLKKQDIFLKTVYPSRALTQKYIQGGTDEKKK